MSDTDKKEIRHPLVTEMINICEEEAAQHHTQAEITAEEAAKLYIADQEVKAKMSNMEQRIKDLTPEQLTMFLRLSGIPEDEISKILKRGFQ